jgi:signal transduction histidine kinase
VAGAVRASPDEVVLIVEDNGVGIDPSLARGGVVNMGERAHDLGGTLEIGRGTSGGTVLAWRVLLR